MKLLLLIGTVVFFLGCQTQPKTNQVESVPSDESAFPQQQVTQEDTKTPTESQPAVKLGLILGPGGARAIAHIGFLKNLQEKRIPVTAVVGIEWGAVVGSLYSQKGSANEAEWQLSKMKNERFRDQSEIKDMLSSLSTYLQSAKAESGRIPFACPSFNYKKAQIYMLARGRLDQLLPYCAAYPTVSQAYDWSLAGTREISRAIDYLKSKGVTRVVLVNVLSGLPIQDPIHWHELAFDMKKKWPGVDQRLDIVIDQKSIRDYKMQAELIQLGSEQTASFVDMLSKVNWENP